MTLIGIENSNNKHLISSKLINYTLSLFEGCDSEIVSFKDANKEIRSKINAAELLVISLSEEAENSTLKDVIELLSKENLVAEKSFFLLSTSSSEQGDSLNNAIEFIEQKGGDVWGSYLLPYAQENFDNKEGVISTINLRLKLMRKINRLRYKKLGIKDYNNSCGIKRSKGEYGDESEH